jgi:hypothetical protein
MRPTKPIEVLLVEAVPGYASTGTLQCERRSHQRYPITFDLEYEVRGRKGVRLMGFGRTINISSRGVLLEISDWIPNRCRIRLSINWPFFLGGSIPLKLLMYGEIVRVASNTIAVRVTGHTFHTAAREMQLRRGGFASRLNEPRGSLS